MVSDKRKQEWIAQFNDPEFQNKIINIVASQRSDPFGHSQLGYWLSLDAWEREEGLYVLAGIEPGTVETAHLPSSTWINAKPFDQPDGFYIFGPEEVCPREDYPGDDSGYQHLLESAENKQAILALHQRIFESLRHRLDRTPSGLGEQVMFYAYRPAQFIAWSKSVGFRPKWLDWAESNAKIRDPIEPMAKPFFDADADDYPELLHIAIRAWEHARRGQSGTAKQRVLDFLQDRYPHLTQGARESIAHVANWQRAGGRPRKGPKTGG